MKEPLRESGTGVEVAKNSVLGFSEPVNSHSQLLSVSITFTLLL